MPKLVHRLSNMVNDGGLELDGLVRTQRGVIKCHIPVNSGWHVPLNYWCAINLWHMAFYH